ncbi:dead deah box [Moniliophthora roreri MCA 2997]|uniref:RNA helicase n=1 Tax=Moniliophthora roreri (strain MCA 2997) TaxID=1381753 RepID=V2XG40_MONRO|nr:dead deah box [Moniliophthora roreri MCA 2997]
MPPRKGIVKSGNAGNSSKASKPIEAPTAEGEKPLFPPGSKYPLSLLHERCQKNGWEKPIVDTVRSRLCSRRSKVTKTPSQRKQPNGWSFVVTLSRMNKKTSQKDTVRMEPHPPYICPSALEARHWGAVYALYRFCNSIQLNRVLPRGPADYWNELANEHKNAPEHQKWMYDADPFAAKREVEERQARAAEKRAEAIASSSDTHKTTIVSNEFSQAPEVRMASSLRDMVEDAIKQGMALYPETSGQTTSTLSEDASSQVEQQLLHLGFKVPQTRNATQFLSTPSSMTANLMKSLSPLEASIEYLILNVPECDLPERFLPSSNSSNPFITSAHSGTDYLKKRWVEDKAVKVAGWPPYLVKECTSDPRLVENWDLLIAVLGRRLIGNDAGDVFDLSQAANDCYTIDPDESVALGAQFEDQNHLIMPLFSAPASLHVHICKGVYPHPGLVPAYITSTSVPPYVRLHLLSQLLHAMNERDFIQPGEGFSMAAMRVLEDAWATVESDGPPEISGVLKHILPSREIETPLSEEQEQDVSQPSIRKSTRTFRRRDQQSNEEIKKRFEARVQSLEYQKILAAREKLPSFSAKDQFLAMLESNRVVVVVGQTGCGKTTQLPQFILDSLILADNGSKASILVTQPRRISALGVAARVSYERLDDGSVGYAIRGESKQTDKTKLLFCTTGVVLRRLSLGDKLADVTHIVVDEVHERSVDGDFLLLELKELLKANSKLKVVLMSATINHETFVKYFNGAPLLTIPGFTHPVTDLYLEDFIPKLEYRPPAIKGKQDKAEAEKTAYMKQGLDEQSVTSIMNISRSERIDYQLIAALVDHLITSGKQRGGVLIFLPGVQEIRQCMEALKATVSTKDAEILPLHANLSSDEQMKVFAKTSKWKLIATTNVAETSITIDDVIYVIDTGKVKETQYDHEANLSRLMETWITRAAARQRRGRAGRTQPGVCYKLYTRKQEKTMGSFPIPEILRVPLENISLSVKVMREDEDVKLYLNQAIDPPQTIAIDKAWSTLQEVGAVDEEGKLTALGRHMSLLPIDLRLAKMLVLGTIFRCLGPILTIAASLSSKPLFVSPMDKREEATKARARFATGNSDLLTDAYAYDECMKLSQEGKSQGSIRQFCEQNFISPSTLREISMLRREYLGPLISIGFVPLDTTPSTDALNVNSNNVNLVKAIVVGGLWPRVARVHLPKSAIKFDKVQAGTVQRENTAKEYKIYDLRDGRVFLHPGSVLFGNANWKSPFIVYFQKAMTTKMFLRDATEIPLFALLLFGGSVSVDHVKGGLTMHSRDSVIKLKAWPRIGVLVNQLRRLLEAQLSESIESGSLVDNSSGNAVCKAMLNLLRNDGLSE